MEFIIVHILHFILQHHLSVFQLRSESSIGLFLFFVVFFGFFWQFWAERPEQDLQLLVHLSGSGPVSEDAVGSGELVSAVGAALVPVFCSLLVLHSVNLHQFNYTDVKKPSRVFKENHWQCDFFYLCLSHSWIALGTLAYSSVPLKLQRWSLCHHWRSPFQ